MRLECNLLKPNTQVYFLSQKKYAVEKPNVKIIELILKILYSKICIR